MMIMRGVRQVDVARACGVSGTSVRKIIAGKPISNRIREDIAARLGRSVQQLWPKRKTRRAI